MKSPRKRLIADFATAGRRALGRLPQLFDRRDFLPANLMATHLPAASKRVTRHWPEQWRGDQGQTPQCVAYSLLHVLHAEPVVPAGTKRPVVSAAKLYSLAQDLDEYPGSDYEGTSIRGGCKALAKLGLIERYVWAEASDDLVRCVLDWGPAELGIVWYTGMFEPDSEGLIKPTGIVEGGHGIAVSGVNVSKSSTLTIDGMKLRPGEACLTNSWGLNWGAKGRCRIRLPDLYDLIWEQQGECVKLVEKGVKAKTRR